MITINDNDLPITVAEKIITGTKPYARKSSLGSAIEKLANAITGEEEPKEENMFTRDEIQEIAHYLLSYCIDHQED